MSKELDKLTTQQIAIDLFNIVSNGKYNMNDLVYYFDRIEQALTDYEQLQQEVIARQETENSLTQWVADLTNELEALKTPPTVDEVCKELDKWYIEECSTGDLLIANINDFTYDKKEKIFYKRMLNKPYQMTICRLDTNDCVQLREPLPPHLTIMIGRFYESLEGEK